MRTLGLCPGSCFPPEVLPQHWPPLLRWVRVPNPFPTIIARMQPSDSPCRVSMPPVCPRLCLTSRASVGSVRHDSRREAGRRSACSRRRVGVGHRFSVARIFRLDGQGSPRLPGRLLRPCHSRPPRRSPFGSPLTPPGMLLSGLLSP